MRVLVVDDEPNIRRTLRVALEAMGHEAAEAASGAEALRQVERRPCDVALVDLRLGAESGLDLLEALIEQAPRLAVVVITAHASVDTAVAAMRRGAFDYLPKPFTPALVRAVLDAGRPGPAGFRDRVHRPGRPRPRGGARGRPGGPRPGRQARPGPGQQGRAEPTRPS